LMIAVNGRYRITVVVLMIAVNGRYRIIVV
jgi:hypothetical protein